MDQEFLSKTVWGNSIQNYLLFGAILILGLLFKRFISRMLSKLFRKVFGGFGEALDPDVFTNLLVKPIEFLLTLLVLYTAINQLSHPLDLVIFHRSQVVNNKTLITSYTLIQLIDKVFIFFIVISVFWIILRIVDFVAAVFMHRALLTESKSDDQLVPFLKELTKVVVIIVGVFVLMGAVFNLNIATIIAGLGIGGIAIALAAKESLENLLGSFTIFIDKPFVVGDIVKIVGYEGTIEKVGFRSTLLRTTDKTLVTVPNKKMIDGPLENLTLRNLRRMKFNIGLTYSTSAETMAKISKEIESTVNDHPATSNETLVTFDSFGDFSLNLQVLYFIEITNYTEYMRIREEINYLIMKIIQNNKADFAFPTQTIYLEKPQDTEEIKKG